MNEKNLIFGLDIGTRTVIGVVGFQNDKNFEIIAMEIEEHDSRAMMDGQIHNIAEVTKAVLLVKERLEKKIGRSLKEVAIAAAGRSLKTCTVKVENHIDSAQISSKHIRALEIDGVTLAEESIRKELNDTDLEYFCVAHTVINFYLDGYMIANLEGHKGRKIGAEVIATFLPKSVVDSLYSVVNRAGLSVSTLTLEPIAAINVAIPEKLRLLNLCLLDIGAGTSDLAITKEGSIIAYGMIPVAGDELTEKLVHTYLLDFTTAEKMKIDISKKEEVTVADILGTVIKLKREEVYKTLIPAVTELAKKIAVRIKELNSGKAPNAIFCVGGGGQIANFTSLLAQELGLPEERVALRSSKLIESVEYKCEPLEGTNMVTPIGICLTSISQKGYNFIEVKLNGEKVRLLNARKLKIMDAGIVKEFNHENLIGRKGKDLRFTLNGKPKKIIGEMGIQAEIKLNAEPADLETLIKDGDSITIKPAENGKDAIISVSDLIDHDDIFNIKINDREYEVKPTAKINGNIVEFDQEIQNDDIVEIYIIRTLEDISLKYNLDFDNKALYSNEKLVDLSYRIKYGDSIYTEEKEVKVEKKEIYKENAFTNIDKSVIIVLNGKKITLGIEKDNYIFVDLFNYIDVDASNKNGKLHMMLNGKAVSLTDVIKDGDIAEIMWISE